MGDLGAQFEALMAVVRRLRAPDGCPWDRAQTHESLRRFALEEAHEVVLAISGGDAAEVCEELGDLLLQVCLHAAIAEQEGSFGPGDVVDGLRAKLVRRHPHVFGEAAPAGSPAEVERRWAEIKRAEAAAAEEAGAAVPPAAGEAWLDHVPHGLPALAEAQGLGERAAEVGFDWPDAAAAWPKVAEESAELEEAWRAWDAAGRPAGGPRRAVAEELGDILFSTVNVARLLQVDAELALIDANARFRRRFARVEQAYPGGPQALAAGGLDALNACWERAKHADGDRGGPGA